MKGHILDPGDYGAIERMGVALLCFLFVMQRLINKKLPSLRAKRGNPG